MTKTQKKRDMFACIALQLNRSITPPIPNYREKVRDRWWMWIDFFQKNGLFKEVVAETKEDMPDDLCIYDDDLTPKGDEFASTGYQKWLSRCTYDGPPKSGDLILRRELEKLEQSGWADPEKIEPFIIPMRPPSTIKPSKDWEKYDDASFHTEGDFPDELGGDAAYTHIGMFLSWLVLSGFGDGEDFGKNGQCLPVVEQLRTGKITPGRFMQILDGSFFSEQLSDEGNAFVQYYYKQKKSAPNFWTDYQRTLGKMERTMYHVKDSWKNFMTLKPVLDKRLADWEAAQAKKKN